MTIPGDGYGRGSTGFAPDCTDASPDQIRGIEAWHGAALIFLPLQTHASKFPDDPYQGVLAPMRCSICRDSTLGGCHEDPANPSRRLSLQRRQADGGFLYKQVLNMDLLGAIAEDRVPSTEAPDPYMHIFLDAGAGNILAFFELPNSPPMGKDPNTPEWTQHIALQVKDMDELLEAKTRAEAAGLDVIGVADRSHESSFNRSISGIRAATASRSRRGRQHRSNWHACNSSRMTWSRNGPEPRALPGTRRGSTRRRLRRQRRKHEHIRNRGRLHVRERPLPHDGASPRRSLLPLPLVPARKRRLVCAQCHDRGRSGRTALRRA